MNKTKIRRRCTFVICIILCLLVCKPVMADEQDTDHRVVRVAYFDIGSYYTEQDDGSVRSYDTDVLQKISGYSNLTFQYVNCGTWANALVKLKKHEIDLIGTAQWNEERENTYAYCQESYGYTVGEFATLPDKKIVYEDYKAIGKATIGCTASYVRMQEMQEAFEKNHVSPKIKKYDTQQDLEVALKSGDIDIIAANSHTMHDDWTVIEKFSFSPYYFISWRGNEQLTKQIDNALIKINLEEPYSDDTLIKQYFPGLLGEPLNKAERDLIAQKKTYTVYYSTDVKPLAWYDEKTDTMKGALVDACAQVTESTGLKINMRPEWESKKKDDSITVKYTTLFKNSSADISQKKGVTDALLSVPFNLYHKSGTDIDINSKNCSIAFIGKRNLLKKYLKEKYPSCRLVSCDSPKECVDKLESGEVNLAYLCVHVADNVMTKMGIDDIREIPVDPETDGIGLYFEGDNSELLKSIVNKGIQKIDQTEISNQMVQYALTTEQDFSLQKFMEDYTGWVIAGVIIVLIILLVFAIVLTYARVMRRQRNRIEQADRDRSEFFARMSHDMRTPMNGMIGMIGLSKKSQDVKEIHNNLVKAEASGEYMLSLINDTLDLQKLETGKMKLQENVVYAKEYFENIFAMLKIAAAKKNIEFRVTNINVELEKYIGIDAIRVKQIFTNLLSNAVKFTPEGGTVEVIMECLGSEGDISHKKFQIRDTGVGMSKDFIENKIFSPYAQENSKITRELTGTGLGLAITKNLIDVMKGTIEVNSELGEGTTFTFYLDFKNVPDDIVAQEEEKRKKKVSTLQSGLEGRNILLCEDHPLNAEIAKRFLEKAGCKVTWAQDGEKGLECFAHSELGEFDAILMDIRMPVMDGLAATRAIREIDRNDAKKIPIIAMTANAYESDKKKSLEAGMNAHLAKPVKPMLMYETIMKCIGCAE